MVSLGFDASMSTVGYVYTDNKEIIYASFIDVSKYKTNREKAWAVIDVIKKNVLTEKVERVSLEGSLSGFAGPSSRTVVIKLARWNAIFQYVLEDYFKKPINLVNVSTARKQVLGKSKIKGMKPKEYVKMAVDNLYDMKPWFFYNKLNNVDKRMEDVYDALIISLYEP